MDDCDIVVCAKCKTALPASDFHKRYRGGRVSTQSACKACQRAYSDRRRAEIEAAGDYPTEPLRCRRCNEIKPPEEFNRTTTHRTGRCAECRACQAARNRDRYKGSGVRLLVLRHLAATPCVDCGEADFRVLTFDHVRGDKSFNLSAAASLYKTEDVVRAEIAKCDVRCANCHLRMTGQRAGWYRDLDVQDGRLVMVEEPIAQMRLPAGKQMTLGLPTAVLLHGNAKISPDTVRAIRDAYRNTDKTMHVLAAEHGTTFGAVQGLLVGRTWAHVSGPILGRDYTRGGDCEVCSVPGCGGPYFSNGLCTKHYAIARRVRTSSARTDEERTIASAWRGRVNKGKKPGRTPAP